MELHLKAYAKLNISLDILSRMDDGYHEMCMVMQSVSLHDDIRMKKTDSEISVRTNLKYLPCDDRNIAVKAARLFFGRTGIRGGAAIEIEKRTPVCSGMGGGSSDAAAVLRGLNELYGVRLTANELEVIGRDVGSDVPFCIAGGTALATGRGEVLEDLPPIPDCHIVICKPGFSISTPELFSRIRCDKIRCRPDTKGIIDAIGEGDLPNIARRMYNVFEDVLPKSAADIRNIKQTLLECDALGSVMTGTGSAVFGLFDCEERAVNACSVLKDSYQDCFLARPVGKIQI